MADSTMKVTILAVDKASKTLGGIGGNLNKLGIAAAAGLAAFGASSVKAYGEAEAAQLKLNDAFDKFPKLADTNVQELNGLNQALQLKTKYDDEAYASAEATLAQYKLTGAQIKELTPLVADYASKTGTDLASAAGVVGKALLGKGKALGQVGIAFKDAGSIEANYTQITQGLRTQVGGFAEKEGKTAAGQAAILKNQFGELQETTGALLVPALTSLMGTLTPIINGFNTLPTPVKNTALYVGLVGTAALVAAPKVLALREVMAGAGGVSGAAGKFRGSLKSAAGFLTGPWGIAIMAGVTAAGLFARAKAKAKAKVDAFTSSLEADSDALGENTRKLAAQNLESSGALRAAQRLGISIEDVTEAALGNTSAQGRINAALALLTPRTEEQAEAMRDSGVQATANADDIVLLTDAIGGQNSALNEAKAARDREQQALGKSTKATKTNTTAVEKITAMSWIAAASTDDFKRALDALKGTTLDAEQANIRWHDAIDDARDALKENGRTSDVSTEKGRANRDALLGIISATNDRAAALRASDGTSRRANQVVKDGTAAFYDMAAKMGMSKSEADKIRTAIIKIPAKKKATVEVAHVNKTSSQTLGDLSKLTAGASPGSPASARVAVGVELVMDKKSRNLLAELSLLWRGATTGSAAQARAAAEADKVKNPDRRAMGGPVRAGVPYIVGENRPELFVPSQNGTILPRVPSSSGASSGGGVSITGGTFIGASKADVARWLSEIMRDGKARGVVFP